MWFDSTELPVIDILGGGLTPVLQFIKKSFFHPLLRGILLSFFLFYFLGRNDNNNSNNNKEREKESERVRERERERICNQDRSIAINQKCHCQGSPFQCKYFNMNETIRSQVREIV